MSLRNKISTRVTESQTYSIKTMQTIKKKIWPKYFQKILNGQKKFELRLNDFEINEGDILLLEEWDPETKNYTGRKIEKKTSYILKFKPNELPFWTKEEIETRGLQIISLE